jgi:hypothetical protein
VDGGEWAEKMKFEIKLLLSTYFLLELERISGTSFTDLCLMHKMHSSRNETRSLLCGSC